MTWHVSDEVLAHYAQGSVDVAAAASTESHVLACADCRARLNALAPAPALAAVWDDVVDTLDAPRGSLAERVIVRLGFDQGDARLIAATPSLRLSWLGALVFTLAVAVLAAQDSGDARAFLGLAPLLPVAGVATAYGRGVDPMYDISSAAPYSLVRLLLLRVATVLATSAVLVSLGALALPRTSWSPLAILLPALALTMLSLALATVLRAPAAAAVVALTWLTLVGGTRRRIPVESLTGADGQLTCAALAVAAALFLYTRRDQINLGGSA